LGNTDLEFTGERFISTLNEAEISYEHWHRYLLAGCFVRGKVVLDIASGDGYGSHLLSNSGALKVIGVDIDPKAVESAGAAYANDNLAYLNGSIADMPVADHAIDVLVSFETIEHVDETLQADFLREAERVLKPGGIMIISTPDKETYSDIPGYQNEFHVKEFYVDEFMDFLGHRFKHIALLGQKTFTASYIWAEKGGASDFREFALQPTPHGYQVADPGAKRMLYAVAVCSNAPLPRVFSSMLLDREERILSEKNALIRMKSREVREKDSHIALKNNEISQKEEEISQKEDAYQKLHQYLTDSQAHIAKLEERLRNRSVKFQAKRAVFAGRYMYRGARETIRLARHNPRFILSVLGRLKQLGWAGCLEKIQFAMSTDTGLKLNAVYTYPPLDNYPKISVVMPVYNVRAKWLSRAVDSVLNQAYDNFELIVVDDGSDRRETLDYLRGLDHEKVVVRMNKTNQGISGASNDGAALATGTYIALLDNDDEYRENALYEVARAVNEADPDVIYTDEAKIDVHGNKKLPFLKPDWSPDLLRSQMYICHLLVFKKSLFEKAGGFRSEFDGSQDYDLMLRMSELTSNIYHIPKILYFWREIETSTAMNPACKPASQDAGRIALDQHLKRLYGPDARAEGTAYQLVYDARYPLPDRVKASVIIPTKDHVALLSDCVDSILNKTAHRNYEIIIVDNGSREQATRDWLDRTSSAHENIRVVAAPYPFNWSKVNNQGADLARGDVLVFLNNDTKVINPQWLTRICENAIRPDIGVVGGLLVYEDGDIQHAGVVVGMGGWADHVFKGLKPVHLFHPFVSPLLSRNVSSVTGACLGISRKTFDAVGGFNEEFIICGSDVDIALKAMRKGYFNLYCPQVNLYHLESKSRSSYIPQVDFEMSRKAYAELKEKGDPFYNPNLSLDSVIPEIKRLKL